MKKLVQAAATHATEYSLDDQQHSYFIDGAIWAEAKLNEMVDEQCRLNGMGQERELALMARNQLLQKEIMILKEEIGTLKEKLEEWRHSMDCE